MRTYGSTGPVRLTRSLGSSSSSVRFYYTAQGSAGARVSSVPRSEQNIQGGELSQFYQRNNIRSGNQFNVRIRD